MNVRYYFTRLSVLIACSPTKFYYKCQMFLWWRLFLSFADSLKVLGCAIHFQLIQYFLDVESAFSIPLIYIVHFQSHSHT